MTTYTAIPNSDIDRDSPITEPLMTLLRDNPIAITEGAVGAPRILSPALDLTYTTGSTTLTTSTNATIVTLDTTSIQANNNLVLFTGVIEVNCTSGTLTANVQCSRGTPVKLAQAVASSGSSDYASFAFLTTIGGATSLTLTLYTSGSFTGTAIGHGQILILGR
jgi:hypothetical protein